MRIEMNCKNMKNVVAPQDIHRIACVLYANEKGEFNSYYNSHCALVVIAVIVQRKHISITNAASQMYSAHCGEIKTRKM